ncbi:MAG: BACON domain-containing carbohydrate-binding protein [bacterium]
MKKFLLLSLTIIMVALSGSLFAQQTKGDQSKSKFNTPVDTRIDNMGYWKKMAESGVIPYNPDIPLTPAIYKGSQINMPGVITVDSPDVPVTNLTNVTESENSVFVDPNNSSYLLNSNNSTSWSGGEVGTLYGANYFQSSNAGIGWVGSPTGAGGSNSGDPTTAIGSNGREYVNFIDNPGGQGIAYSDNGTTWSTSTIAPNPGDLCDKNHMWIDNKSTSPYEGNLYAAWTDFGGANDSQIKISRSINDGVTWSTSLNISSAINAGSHNQGVNIQTGPAGEVYVAWAVYDSWPSDETAIGFAKSTNGGISYPAATRIISNIKGIRYSVVSKNHRVNSFPVMAVDISGGPNNGNIYIVWTNIGVPGTNTGTNRSVYMIRSTNGGSTWSTPVRVNQGPNVAGKEAYFPWISCDPETGVLSVVFYDDRNVSSTQCEVFTAYSTDAGNTWTDFKVSDVAFTPSPIPGLAGGYMGDYLGITSKGGKVYPCWTDNRGGLYMTYVSPFELGLNAGFTANNTLICIGSGVTFTDLSTGPPTSWTWSFPGGTPSSYSGKFPPAIVYSTPGSYDVSLTVSDGVTTDTETKTGYITVKNVIADFTGTPTNVVVGNNVTFSDNSSCSPTSWTWSFPGGTPSSYSGQTPPAITYSTLGTYDVSLTVTNASGSDTKTKTGYITVSPPVFIMTNGSITTCTGDFYDSGGPANNYQNNETFVETFYPTTPGSMIRFIFTSFATELDYDTLTIYNGPNSSSPLIGKYHGTNSPGTVTASNASGALTFRFHSDAIVTYAGWAATISCYSTTSPPVADFSASILYPLVGQTVAFTDLSQNFPTSWSWSFNPSTVTFVGGTSASSQNPQVQFSNLGFYSVTLTAMNTYGSGTVTKTNYINVTNCTFNTLPFSESFSTTSIPNCWSQVDHQGNGQIWEFGVITNTSPPLLTGNYAFLNSDGYGSGHSQNADLVTPLLDLSGYSAVNLQFIYHFKGYTGSSGALSYSIDGGTNWTQIQSFVSTSANPATFNQAVSAVNGKNQVKFKWNYTGAYGYWWAIDDVLITGTSTGPALVVTPPNQNVTVVAGTTPFTVTSNREWTAESDQTWCTVTPSGTGNGTITATYTQNPLPGVRIANITVTVAGLTPVVVTVTQVGTSAPALSVSPPNQNVTEFAGTTPFTVTSNVPWNVSSDQTWCTVTPSGTGNGTITATFTQNLLLTSRVANVTVSVAGLSPVIVTVTQAGATPTISVNPLNQNVTSPGGFVTFTVVSNLSWTVSSNMSWCTVDPVSGNENGTFDAIYGENTAITSRVVTLTVTAPGLNPITVTVTQAGIAPTLTVQPANQDVSYAAGSAYFTVTSNTNWTAISDASWCTVTLSGSGNDTIFATYSSNPDNTQRVANIIVTVSGLNPLVVTLTQAEMVSLNELSIGGIRIYPNPAKGSFKVTEESDSDEILEIVIMDYTGRVISSNNGQGLKEYEFDLSYAPQGVYMVKIKTTGSYFTRKLVISR